MLSRWQLHNLAQVLDRGGVIAYPTESVYGLGCEPNHLAAIARILEIKNRPVSKGLILLVSHFSQALPFVKPLSNFDVNRISQVQPRATTWLLPKRVTAPELLCGQYDTLAVRLTQHPVAKQICDYTNSALISTSCNLTGKPELINAVSVRNQMKTQLDWIVSAPCGGQKPSRIIDFMSNRKIRS